MREKKILTTMKKKMFLVTWQKKLGIMKKCRGANGKFIHVFTHFFGLPHASLNIQPEYFQK